MVSPMPLLLSENEILILRALWEVGVADDDDLDRLSEGARVPMAEVLELERRLGLGNAAPDPAPSPALEITTYEVRAHYGPMSVVSILDEEKPARELYAERLAEEAGPMSASLETLELRRRVETILESTGAVPDDPNMVVMDGPRGPRPHS
jgi:hypothetical protein